jgi:hypothetical protein
MSELGLADAIRDLRAEIAAAMAAAEGERLQFVLGPVQLELQLQLKASAKATAGLKWVVVAVGGEAQADRTRTHTVKLTLTPRDGQGGDVKVRDKTPGRPG